ncbi:hypothetical protein Plec18167_000148 [Paecilomyces lecythidis]|uniref:Metallo-beta-lactamase domain-containing protein n=1 Tax=Paecilomyces lecythidis TaxID=3004212 RepID=A0ABR3YFK2_9EURO
MAKPLETYFHISSEKGLSSVTSLVVGVSEAALFDPPLLVPDANETVSWVKKTLSSQALKAVFVTHHHPDHYFSANPILEAFPGTKFYAAPYVLAGINKEYDDKVAYWPSVFGRENIPVTPQKPEPFLYTFFVLDGNPESPVHLLGPVQGDSVDHTLFWMPSERTIICGDSVYARSTHVWVEELESPELLEAWSKTLLLIEALHPIKLIPGHIEEGWEPNTAADLAHMKKYLSLFGEKITYAPKKPQVAELFSFFKESFPQATKNVDFFLGHLSNQFGEGGQVWEENRHQDAGRRTREQLQGYWFK